MVPVCRKGNRAAMDIRRRIFHKATIGGQCFNGVLLNEGPYLFWGNGANVPIGVAGLRYYVEPPEIGHKPLSPGWWMVKYGKELRMDLHWLTDSDAEKLSSEFGRQEYFYTSPAWDGLRKWVCAHPRMANQASDDDLIGWRRRMAIELKMIFEAE
jgi:hypothetical protein